MLNSNERMDYINRYLSAYENKIKMANQQGLFDAAKMFELFAANVCALWFGQPFKNLNTEVANYPYVDLISEDQELFVQVSTVQDISGKIKSTLENIRDTKDSRFSRAKNIVFFMLHNQSVDRVSDFTGDAQIGNIPFMRKDNLISTQDILSRAQTDFEFQSRLYGLLKTDEFNASTNEAKFREALAFSRNVGLKNINCFIHGEYQIDRSSLVDKVKTDAFRFISIQGAAGSGKSAFCKILLENEELVLYARAERFLEESNLNDIWSLDIEKVLTYINGKKLTFFIDALEFIADCRQTKFELLQQLYIIAQTYENVYIVTSCRSSEKGAFIKLETNLGIHSYLVDDLPNEELLHIAAKYPVIKKMCGMKAYSSLLRIPFYIELILEKNINPDDIHDEVAFREYIWNSIICLKERAKNYHLKFNEIVQTVERIVFDRAKQNLMGIRSDKVDSDILKALISERVLTEQGTSVRLKYDIFEDICFEQYFDEKFQECQGDYQLFYNEIGDMGRCVYRRYQIWISNKLFGSQDRAKFLHNLVFTDTIPPDWKKQTEIGIMKSRYCTSFFDEQELNIQESGQLWDFVNITNLFAFEVQIHFVPSGDPKLDFYPIGNGRPALIQLIYKYGLFKNAKTERTQIVKLCQDYAKQRDGKKDAAPSACAIATYYVDEILKECNSNNYYHLIQGMSPCLTIIYQMPTAAEDWLKSFLNQLSDFYRSDDPGRGRVAEDTIQWTMKNAYPQLVSAFPKELCALFEVFWTKPTDTRETFYQHRLEDGQRYGLNEHAENYSHKFRTVESNPFLWNLFTIKFSEGFEWAISFVNRSILAFAETSPQEVTKIQLYFTESEQTRIYWGNPNMWLVGIEEYNLPVLIGDIIYILKDVVIKNITIFLNRDDLGVLFANWVKEKLYTEANNIALLTIIECVGMHFQQELPGYALDLATSIPLIYWDIQRYAGLYKDPTRDLLEKQILLTVGIPSLKSRYEKDPACNCTLQEYVFSAQFHPDDTLKQSCCQMMDYLYSRAADEELDAKGYLQIQKMDAREAEVEAINENMVALKPHIHGKGAEYVAQQKQSETNDEALSNKLQVYIERASKEETETADVLILIDTVIETMEHASLGVQYENLLIHLVAVVIRDVGLDGDKRSSLCGLWINGIRRLFSNGSFAAEIALCPILFQQIHSNASPEAKNEIKLLILDLLLYRGQNGLISRISNYAKDFLAKEENLSHALLNTIVKLSEDEMRHQKYNADYLKRHSDRNVADFVPNLIPNLTYVDRLIRDEGESVYASQRDVIINEYLFEESPLEIKTFDIQNFDLSTLCRISNCGVKISDSLFNSLMREIISCMVEAWHFHFGNRTHHEALNFDCAPEIVALYQKQMVESSVDAECAIDLLFTEIDFSIFTDETIKFYQDIFGNFLPEFLDAWQEPERRRVCKKKIQYLEQKVNGIEDEHVRIQLYKSLFFFAPKYCAIDFGKCPTSYSYEDICFLNEQFSKYGKYHLQEMLQIVYQLHIDQLLPHILISINDCFNQTKPNLNQFAVIIKDNRQIVQLIIYKAFVKYSEEIKREHQLTLAYESILETLAELDYEDAAVILDEFRLH